MTQARVTVRMTKPGRLALEYPATTEAATNKLFRAAQFELPEPGRWEMQVQVEGLHGLAVIGGEVEAAEPLPRWPEMWPWIGWPALVIVLFVFIKCWCDEGPVEPSGWFEFGRFSRTAPDTARTIPGSC